MRTCRNCGETKDLESGFYELRPNKYHGSGKHWYTRDCKKCKNKMDHDRVLEKMLEDGSRHITNCSECDRLMKKMATRDCCFECHKEKKDGP